MELWSLRWAARGKLVATAGTDARSPLHALDCKVAVISDGRIAAGDASEFVSDLVARNHPDGLEAEGEHHVAMRSLASSLLSQFSSGDPHADTVAREQMPTPRRLAWASLRERSP
jgi:hypothetical protein